MGQSMYFMKINTHSEAVYTESKQQSELHVRLVVWFVSESHISGFPEVSMSKMSNSNNIQSHFS